MRRNAKLFAVYSLLVMFALIPTACIKKVSEPFRYSGYTTQKYNSYTRASEYIAVSDGTKLAATRFLPSEDPSEGPYPAVFIFTPYHRESINLETGEIVSPMILDIIPFLTSYGYAVVIADIRGTGASQGVKVVDRDPRVGEDGRNVINWIATQSWCDGNVGMIGGSYVGWSQYAVAGKKTAGLKCIIPEITDFDAYSSVWFYPGGIYNKGFNDLMSSVLPVLDKNLHLPPGFKPAVPAVDEDKDGDLTDEIPLDLDGSGTFLDEYQLPDNPPQYKDGKERQHIYYLATLEHLRNSVLNKWSSNSRFRDCIIPVERQTYRELGPGDFPAGIKKSGIPVYNMGGWFDGFTRGAAQWHATLQKTNPSRMVIGPGNHRSLGYNLSNKKAGPYWKYFGMDITEVANGYNMERLRFLDHYLKGIKNGIDKEPPVYIYVMNGEGWRFEDEWPLERQILASLYFEEGNTLSLFKKSVGSDDYQADFTHDSRQESSLANRWNIGRQDHVDIRNSKDLQCLTYTSEPIKMDAEVTGHPVVHLHVSSTSDYGDFFVYLEDVDENGDAYFVTDGMLRAGFAKLLPNEDILPPGAGIDVKPELPWHGFKEVDYVDGILTGGNIVELTFDLIPTSWVFKKGHRVRISIACADWPTFRLHPKLSPANDPADSGNIVPKVTVYRDINHRSYIELPVIPKKKMKPEKSLQWIKNFL